MLCRSTFAVVLILFCCVPAMAQDQSVEFYDVRVSTQNGKHLRGVLYDVTERDILLNNQQSGMKYIIPLTLVRKVVVRFKRRKSTLEGAIVGGGLLAFFTIRSSKENPFRSSVLYGVNLLAATAAGAAAGGLLGSAIGPQNRRTIRPFGQTRERIIESLRGQLEPFTFSHQSDVLNRVPL
jgi:hypothetical protein